MRHPRWNPGPAKTGTNYSNKAGAEKLAAMIREAWASVGHDVPAVVLPTVARCADRDAIYTVAMPTLHNGLPPR